MFKHHQQSTTFVISNQQGSVYFLLMMRRRGKNWDHSKVMGGRDARRLLLFFFLQKTKKKRRYIRPTILRPRASIISMWPYSIIIVDDWIRSQNDSRGTFDGTAIRWTRLGTWFGIGSWIAFTVLVSWLRCA